MADSYLVLVMKPDAFADPAVIANLEIPGEFDSGARSKDNTVAYFGPEQS